MFNSEFVKRIGADNDLLARAESLHKSSVVVDGSSVIHRASASLPTRWDRYTDGGVTATNHTVTTPRVGLQHALREVNEARRWLDVNSDRVMLCRNSGDIYRAKESDLGGILFGPQDTSFLGEDLNNLGTFYDLGVRILQLTYQKRNYVGDGCGERNPGKLSDFGRSAVREMQEIGYLIDLSHTSETTSFDALEMATKPMVLTHAHPSALTRTIRSKSDDLLKAVAETGGTVGITAISTFTRLTDGPERPTLEDYLTHIDYLVELLGPQHVAVASDFDETSSEESFASMPDQEFVQSWFGPYGFEGWLVDGYSSAAETPGITLGLLSKGYDEESVKDILGRNFMRVMDEAGCV